jgi:hypothetical protein
MVPRWEAHLLPLGSRRLDSLGDTWQVPAEGGAPTRITQVGSSAVKYESADGKALVYQSPVLYESVAPRPFAYQTLGDTPLMAVPIGGGTPRQSVPCVKAPSRVTRLRS